MWKITRVSHLGDRLHGGVFKVTDLHRDVCPRLKVYSGNVSHVIVCIWMK